MSEGPKIVLPQDESRRKALETKLEEYQGRLRTMRGRNSNMYHSLFRKMSVNAGGLGYRIDMLECLFVRGELNTREFSLELDERDGFLDIENYNQAAAVIDDYCKTGGQNAMGGTGLQMGNTN